MHVLTVQYAAVQLRRHPDVVAHLPRPFRHPDVIRKMHDLGLPHGHGDLRQGFVLSDGSFADRQRAAEVAIAAGQLLPNAPYEACGVLTTEDLW